MTVQHVNLYLPELRPKKEWLTASTIALSAAGFVCLLCVIGFLLNKSLLAMEEAVVVLERQASSSAERIARFGQGSQPLNAVRLDREIKDLNKAISAREQIDQIIRGQNLGNEAGFSEGMMSLARQSLSSIAISHIKISRGGAFIEIKGVANAAQDVPIYIQTLRRQEVFSNTQFGLLSLIEDKSSEQLYRFAMGFEAMSELAATGEATQ